jgi:hypothetical protein
MRPIAILAAAAILAPATLFAHPAASGLSAPTAIELAAAKKKKAAPKKKEEYLKAAPGAGPSGPATKY